MDALVALPGVGRKTANVVLGHALGVPGLPVDRHVLRVSNRIGIAESDDPVVVEQQLCAALPAARWTRTSDTLILHGRRVCKPKPLCDHCAVRDECDYYEQAIAVRVRRPQLEDRHRRETRNSSNASSLTRSSRFRAASATAMQNIAIVVEDEPSPELLAEMEIEPPDTLLGLYQGTPLTERSWDYGNRLPDRILIFQGPHERDAEDEDDLVVAIGETLIHEIGPLLRHERRTDRGDRGALLARRRR